MARKYLQNYTNRHNKPCYAGEAMYEYLQKRFEQAIVFSMNNPMDASLNTLILNICTAIDTMSGTRTTTDIFEKLKEIQYAYEHRSN